MDIVEVGPRDGLQNATTILDTATKVALVKRLVAAGLRRIEVTSFVRPDRVPQLADADAVMAALPRPDGVRYAGLVANRRGLERALRSGMDEINFVVLATDTFNRRNQGVDTATTIREIEAIVAGARAESMAVTVTLGAAFGCPFEGEVTSERVAQLAEQIAAAGPDELSLADTIGVGVPAQVAERTAAVRSIAPGIRLRYHFHNTRNTGYANAQAAVEAGVDALDASVGGVGGCPFAPEATGNIATEDLTYLLERSGIKTGVDLAASADCGRWLGERLGETVPALLGRAGPFPPVDAPNRPAMT